MLPLTVLLVAAFAVSYAVAQAREGEPPKAKVSVPGIEPEPLSQEVPPSVAALGRAAPLPALRARRRTAPAPAPAPAPKEPAGERFRSER